MPQNYPLATTRRRWSVILLGVFVLWAALPATAQQPSSPRLYLHRSSTNAAVSSKDRSALAITAAVPDLFIVQFRGPITSADQDALGTVEAQILEYLPEYAYLVEATDEQRSVLAQLPQVYAITPMLLADKLSPALLAAFEIGELRQPVAIRAYSWLGAAQQELPADAAGLAALVALARDPEVRWVEPAIPMRMFNDKARDIMAADQAWSRQGLYGAGQIIAITDSGLDTGDLETMSPDFKGRILAAHALAPDGDYADQHGHGTHVAGSLAGSGMLSGADAAAHRYDGSLAGVAPEAALVIQAFEVGANGAISGMGDDPYPIFAQAYADGARIHSDSWGGPTGVPFLDPEGYFGGYTTPARQADAFIWEHQDMAIFVAAGNDGNDGDFYLFGCLPNGDGVIDDDSLSSPGTAKNVITIGASETLRTDGKLATGTWNSFFPGGCYAKPPIATDLVADNASGMAAFSSRGPADDGRFKPDLVAPGTGIISARSHAEGATVLGGVYAQNREYVASMGTSMATPLAAGAGVLVREWLGRRGIASPSAAALKAVLLSTSADMAPGQYGTGIGREIPDAWPNNISGWGRVDLSFVSAAAPYRLWLDDQRSGLATGHTRSYHSSATQPLTVADTGIPLRITLAWSDPPASLTAARQLVNDLDLVVTGPDGHKYWGNSVSGGDRINNVEGIIIEVPQQGAYRVEVRAHNVPVSSQPYALVVAGGIAAGAAPPALTAVPATTATPIGAATPTVPAVPRLEWRIWLPLVRR